MNYPYREASIIGQGLLTFGFQAQDWTNGLNLLTDGFVSSELFTTTWMPAIAEGLTFTGWTLALAEGVTLTGWSLAIAEGLTLTCWVDAISEIPPDN